MYFLIVSLHPGAFNLIKNGITLRKQLQCQLRIIRLEDLDRVLRGQYVCTLNQHLIHGIHSLIAKIKSFMNQSLKKNYTHYNHYSHTRNMFVSFPFALTSSGLEVLHIVVRAILSEDIINISLNCLHRPLLGF